MKEGCVKANMEKYDKFVGVVKDFKEEHLYTPGVIDLVKHFFKGYVQLIADLTHFFQKAT